MTECPIRLHRDALNTPWGFRLQGGKDFNTPLTIQRVFAGSPADGEVHRGDIILAIDNYDATQMSHKQAQDLIKKGGGSLSLRIKRSAKVGPPAPQGPYHHSAPQSPSVGYRTLPLVNSSPAHHPSPRPKQPMSGFQGYGVDYNRPHGAPHHRPAQVHYGGHPPSHGSPGADTNMLNRVNQTLSEVVWQPHHFNQQPHQGEDDPYEQKSINQLKQQFGSPVNSPHVRQDDLDEHEEPHRSVRELTQTYQPPRPNYQIPSRTRQQQPISAPAPAPQHHSSGHRGPTRWHKPPPDVTGVPSGLSEPGWTPGCMKNAPARPQHHHHHQPQHHHHSPHAYTQEHDHPQPVANHPPGRPAWAGTLKASGAPKPWEIQEGQTLVTGMPPEQPPAFQRQHSGGHARAPHAPMHHDEPVVPHQPKVQNVHYGVGGDPVYQQHSPDSHHSDTAQVTHAQYNTPIGLYSQENVQAALDAQTSGKPGQGTLQVSTTGPDGKKTFNPAQSDVYRLLMEEEGNKRPRGHGLPKDQHSARYDEHNPGQEMQYHGYQDHTVQSRSMQNLEYNMSHNHNDEYGTSDF